MNPLCRICGEELLWMDGWVHRRTSLRFSHEGKPGIQVPVKKTA